MFETYYGLTSVKNVTLATDNPHILDTLMWLWLTRLSEKVLLHFRITCPAFVTVEQMLDCWELKLIFFLRNGLFLHS
jgi:hypothetical protein